MTNKDKIDAALDLVGNAPERSFLNKAANEDIIKIINMMHSKFGYGDMPEDFAYLLCKACGIMGPYLTIFSIGGMKTAGGGLQLSILDESEAFNKNMDEEAEKHLALGRVSGGAVLIYKDNKYRLVDGASHDELRVYDGIADFITDIIEMKTKARSAKA